MNILSGLFGIISLMVMIMIDDWPLVSSEAVIGDWKQLNAKRCGLSRLARSLKSDCFAWHNSDDIAKVMNGRNITNGEAPWDVLLVRLVLSNPKRWDWLYEFSSQCAGAIIGNEWVLTAAHCVEATLVGKGPAIDRPNWDLVVVTGHNFSVDQWCGERFSVDAGRLSEKKFNQMFHNFKVIEAHVHPDLKEVIQWDPDKKNKTHGERYHDIALLKLDRPINSDNHDGFDWPYENNICLPTEDMTGVERDEYALTGGYGFHVPWRTGAPYPLLMAPRKILHKYNSSVWIVTHDVPSMNASLCKGDSGAPLWQYDNSNGRAVLVGVLTHGKGLTCSASDDGTGWKAKDTYHERVSRYIDWIIDVTGLDKDHFAQSGHSGKFIDYWNETATCKPDCPNPV